MAQFSSFYNAPLVRVFCLVTAAAGDVLYNTAASYSLTLLLTDQNGLTDTATVVINIIETNDPATWVGAFTAAGAAIPGNPPVLRVSEAAAVGTVFGSVMAVDPNRGVKWGSRIYKIVQSADTAFFSIDASTGSLLVSAPGAAFWDQPTFSFTVTVQDAVQPADLPETPIVVPFNVSVQLIQVNTVTVSGFALPSGTPALLGLNASALPFSLLYAGYPISAAVDALVSTRGVSSLLVFGTGFGRTAARLAREGVPLTPAGIAAATSVTAALGAWPAPAASWAATTCAVVVPNTVLSCVVPPGVGANLTWSLAVQGWPAMSSRAISYMPPTVTSVARQGGGALSTTGSDWVAVSGDNFGVGSTAPLLSYAPNSTAIRLLYNNTNCTVTVAHTQLLCTTLAGVGFDLRFSVSVAGQATAPGLFAPSPPVQYLPPTIAAVTAPLLNTAGGLDEIVINGEDLCGGMCLCYVSP